MGNCTYVYVEYIIMEKKESPPLAGFPTERFSLVFSHLLKCLKTTYFLLGDNYYEGAAMGSPLSPLIAHFTYFEEQAIQTAELKPTLWLRYVDDTFVSSKHGKHHLHQFWDHLNSHRTSTSSLWRKNLTRSYLSYIRRCTG